MTDTTRTPKTDAPPLTLTVNGTEREVAPGTTVTGLLEQLELIPGMIVVERNRTIVPRARYGHVELEEGDQLELVHFVGGG